MKKFILSLALIVSSFFVFGFDYRYGYEEMPWGTQISQLDKYGFWSSSSRYTMYSSDALGRYIKNVDKIYTQTYGKIESLGTPKSDSLKQIPKRVFYETYYGGIFMVLETLSAKSANLEYLRTRFPDLSTVPVNGEYLIEGYSSRVISPVVVNLSNKTVLIKNVPTYMMHTTETSIKGSDWKFDARVTDKGINYYTFYLESAEDKNKRIIIGIKTRGEKYQAVLATGFDSVGRKITIKPDVTYRFVAETDSSFNWQMSDRGLYVNPMISMTDLQFVDFLAKNNKLSIRDERTQSIYTFNVAGLYDAMKIIGYDSETIKIIAENTKYDR